MQNCTCLWVWYTMARFDTSAHRLTENWVRHTPTLFADDCWASWLIQSAGDFQRATRELQILLCTLEDYKMRINFAKTAILIKLAGKQAAQTLHEHTCFRRGTRRSTLLNQEPRYEQSKAAKRPFDFAGKREK